MHIGLSTYFGTHSQDKYKDMQVLTQVATMTQTPFPHELLQQP